MQLKDYTRTLSAGETIRIDVPPSTFIICTAGDAAFSISPDYKGQLQIENGMGVPIREPFTRLSVTNGTTPQTIQLYIGSDQIIDNRLVGKVDISGGIRVAGAKNATMGTATVGIAATQLAGADLLRGSLLVQNLGLADIFLGVDATVTTLTGIRVRAGDNASILWQTTIYAISGVAGNDVRYVEERNA